MLGDARLTLAESPDQYDLIMLDAFSSDAIPIHLMTREAMATYLAQARAGGIVMMHVSNRHMELASVVAGIAHANGLASRINNRAARDGEDDANYIFTSTVVISAREEEDFGVCARMRTGRHRAAGRAAHLDRRLLQRDRRGDPAIPQDRIRIICRIADEAGSRHAAADRRGGPAPQRQRAAGQERIGRRAMPSERFDFPNARGEKLAALLDRPAGKPVAYALFAHCFTCGKDNLAAKRIAEGLTARGIAVLRFDFTGLGASEGEFANTTFSSNVADLVAAADHLRTMYQAPAILIGHSLGGAAVLAAARSITGGEGGRHHRGAAPIPRTSPACSRSTSRASTTKGEVEVALAGRPFRIRKEFLDDVAEQKLEAVPAPTCARRCW